MDSDHDGHISYCNFYNTFKPPVKAALTDSETSDSLMRELWQSIEYIQDDDTSETVANQWKGVMPRLINEGKVSSNMTPLQPIHA